MTFGSIRFTEMRVDRGIFFLQDIYVFFFKLCVWAVNHHMGSACSSTSVNSAWGPYTLATASCPSVTIARGTGSVNPSVIKTLRRSAILVRSGGLKHSVKQLVKSLQW